MIAHVGFTVGDIEKAKIMYAQALAPLGLAITMEGYGYVGFGDKETNCFWIGAPNEKHTIVPTDIHVCFQTDSHTSVDAFYKAGIDAGFRDNGAPGIREMYSPTYYAAFLLDLDGNNIEAVCHE
jgi:catechol 2,3-dioxygenase-like lactoylglutathione lyase family enzyme